MRKSIVLVLIVLSLFALCGCKSSPDTSISAVPPSAPKEEITTPEPKIEPEIKGTIGVMISDMDDKFCLDIEKGIEETLKENGYEIILLDSKGEDINDVYNMQDLLKKDIKGIIYNPYSTLISVDIVRLAVTKGVPVVSVGKVAGEGRVICNVTTDYFKLGENTAQIIANKFGEDFVEMAEIPPMIKSDEKSAYLNGFHSVIDEIYNFRVYTPVLLQGIEPTTELYIAEAFRHNSRIKALIATSDEDALKAVAISKEENFECHNISGLGGSDDAISATKSGDMMVTYKLYPEKMGIEAANVMTDYLDGKDVPSEIFVDVDIITSPTANDVESELEENIG